MADIPQDGSALYALSLAIAEYEEMLSGLHRDFSNISYEADADVAMIRQKFNDRACGFGLDCTDEDYQEQRRSWERGAQDFEGKARRYELAKLKVIRAFIAGSSEEDCESMRGKLEHLAEALDSYYGVQLFVGDGSDDASSQDGPVKKFTR